MTQNQVNMHMQLVESSNIAAIGYDGKDLFIQFKDGAAYRYADVPGSVHVELLKADSIGGYFHQHIKGHYEAFQLEPLDGSDPADTSGFIAEGNDAGDTPAAPNTTAGEAGNPSGQAGSTQADAAPAQPAASGEMIACTVTIFCAANKMADQKDRQSLEDWASKCPWAENVTTEWLDTPNGGLQEAA